ncbi:translation initiation factor IF-2 [Raoultella ornithinolytica]|uniref:Gp138 family membrane-puncturing spike protein n=1 Tax=Klebsiella/Raoultella group TaxID=2890311 RepID=UPI0010BEDA50|nr:MULTISPECIES: Gp138 family membrane-puncturing spike protein [Klebsiella/Raoultella group]HDU4560544.1 translation initiation factor IF-2 [Klebsiella pneumoniae subsp. pneumoniae]MCP6766828.1 translation initiation factor IF-2 [Klebsiella pneumoniae]MDE8937413.1 Gp138 family membrane-puncturing spike protein [Klebsiella pneumoniae]MDE9029908.1 Gp138 family membrane-puncturing spike protein [Klebsiella pneumoniae]QCK79168.1 translation initiation factor IF-2 [Raoultella ornithinolytica]
MGVSSQSRSGALAEVLASERKVLSEQMRVALPGIIQSFDPESVTAVVQPAIRYIERDNDGNQSTKDYPLLVDVPVVFPRGGGCTLTFPVKEGDECLVIFADRCIDFWWQSGGIQEPVDGRMHDLSDAFCIVGPQSQAKKIGGISTTAAQLRTDDGSAIIELAAGGAVTITSPQITINGPLQVNGEITSTGDQLAGGISQIGHTHGGVEPGGGSTGAPQ